LGSKGDEIETRDLTVQGTEQKSEEKGVPGVPFPSSLHLKSTTADSA